MSSSQALKALVATCVCATLVVLVAPPAQSHHRPAMYCSSSGDVCQSVTKIDGVRKLRIDLADRYFGRYELCVKEPAGFVYCETFRIRERPDGTFGHSVNFWRHFAPAGPRKGRYVVRWCRINDDTPPWKCDRIGAVLGFHVR